MSKPSQESFFVRFARDYGWRAYAIPVLAVITVWVLIDVFSPAEDKVTEEPTVVASSTSARPGPDPAKQQELKLALTQLPAGGPYTEKGEGTYRLIGVPGAAAGTGGKEFTYVVEVENGLDTAASGGDDAFATMVDATLTNPKGWTAEGQFSFRHVAPEETPDLRIQLTSVGTTHELCGHDLEMETSCYYPIDGRVVINEARWVRGATPFQGDIGSYRQYLINHEVGHGLGYAQHVPCGKNGELAPIMMQQTLSLSNSELFTIDPNEVYEDDGAVCRANPWPFPKK